MIGNLLKEQDYRTPLDKLRRPQLQRIMDAYNLKYNPQTTPATSMRRTIQEEGIDYRNFDFSAKPKKAEEKVEEVIVDYSEMKRPQLLQLAKVRGIEIKNTDKRVDLIRKLNGENTT